MIPLQLRSGPRTAVTARSASPRPSPASHSCRFAIQNRVSRCATRCRGYSARRRVRRVRAPTSTAPRGIPRHRTGTGLANNHRARPPAAAHTWGSTHCGGSVRACAAGCLAPNRIGLGRADGGRCGAARRGCECVGDPPSRLTALCRATDVCDVRRGGRYDSPSGRWIHGRRESTRRVEVHDLSMARLHHSFG